MITILAIAFTIWMYFTYFHWSIWDKVDDDDTKDTYKDIYIDD